MNLMLALTDEQRGNLTKLADYLAALPADYEQFKMYTYFGDVDEDGDVLAEPQFSVLTSEGTQSPVPECGSCACAIGHGPAAGIAPGRQDISWGGYACRVFGTDESYGAGDYMFGLDNPDDPYAAADRIREVLAANPA